MKVTDNRHNVPGRTPSLTVAKTASDVSRARADVAAQRALAAGAAGPVPTDRSQVMAGTMQRMSSNVTLSGGKPRSLEFWHQRNNNFYDYESNKDLQRLREMCWKLYTSHPLIGSAVDIFSKWPLVGMEMRGKDSRLNDFYSELFLEDLAYDELLEDIGREYWTVGEAFPLGTWDANLGVWANDELVPPQDIDVTKTPFSREPLLEMALPVEIQRIITTREPREQYEALVANYPDLVQIAGSRQRMPISGHLLKHIKFRGHTFHERGIPIMTRGIRAVLQEEMLNGAQDSISDRLSTPLILAKIGATANELGTQSPWVPTQAEINDFQDLFDSALQADFRMMTTHFGVNVSSVFGRETMPNFDRDFERLGERILQVFGMSKTMLSGASGGQTYAADAMNRDLISQLQTSFQRRLKRFARERMLVVAEALEHFDYESRNGKRHVIMEEVLVVDEKGNQRIEEKPKLLVPDLYLKPMNLAEEKAMDEFFATADAMGLPISAQTRFANYDIDFDEEVEKVRAETVERAIQEQETRKAVYLGLSRRGLPIPEDLLRDFEPRITEETAAATAMDQGGDPSPPLLGGEPLGAPEEQQMGPLPRVPQRSSEDAPRTRPPESDEQRADMPVRPTASVRVKTDNGERKRIEVTAGGLLTGPSHIGKRTKPAEPVEEGEQ